MPASLTILPRKEFIITLEDGSEVHGKYGTWAFSHFCEKNNYTLDQAGKALSENFTIKSAIQLVLCAVEYTARRAKAQFGFTELDAGDWLDQLGGMNSVDALKLFMLANDKSAPEESAVEEEKKSEEGSS